MRTNFCGELNKKFIGKEVTICGWIHRRRDHGGVIFLDIRDTTGIVQIVIRPETKETFKIAEQVRSEFVLKATGNVEERPEDSENTTLTTGAYEYFLNSETDSVYRTTTSGGYKNWPTGVGAVKVVYTAGYSAVPSDLKLAVLDLVTYYLRDEHKQRQSIAGASIQNQSSTSQRNNVSFPDHIKRVLDLYKNF